jgi:hypothetical protein
MKATTHDILKGLKANTLPDTEGVEDALVKAAMEAADRKKWSAMLAEEGIERDKMPMQVAQTGLKAPKNTRWIMGIAAGLLLVASVVWLMRPSESVFSVAAYMVENRFTPPSTRMGTADPNTIWQQAKTAFHQKNDAEVERLLADLPNKTDEQLFYLALSRLYQGKASESIVTFNNLMDKSDFGQEAAWFAALAYWQSGDKAAAKGRLQSIVTNKSWNHALAEKLLQQK